MPPQKDNKKATQDFVPVKEVRNGVIILKSGGFRGAFMCSSVNFSLKSADEQRAVIGGFQNFLNTLDFSVQILIHSRKIDIRPYLELLNTRLDKQTSELMQIQVREYINFIRSFIEGAEIMTKMFYVVVPFDPPLTGSLGKGIPGFGNSSAPVSADKFDEYRVQLEQRMSLVEGGLGTSGVRAVRLGTEELIELLFRSFNPGELETPIRLTQQ